MTGTLSSPRKRIKHDPDVGFPAFAAQTSRTTTT